MRRSRRTRAKILVSLLVTLVLVFGRVPIGAFAFADEGETPQQAEGIEQGQATNLSGQSEQPEGDLQSEEGQQLQPGQEQQLGQAQQPDQVQQGQELQQQPGQEQQPGQAQPNQQQQAQQQAQQQQQQEETAQPQESTRGLGTQNTTKTAETKSLHVYTNSKSGSISVDGTDSDADFKGTFDEGKEVSIQANPVSGYKFSHWGITKADGSSVVDASNPTTVHAGTESEAYAMMALETTSVAVVAPIAGQTSEVAPMASVPEGACYTVESAAWVDSEGSAWTGAFEEGETYYMHVVLKEGEDRFAGTAGGASFDTQLSATGGIVVSQGVVANSSDDGGYYTLEATISIAAEANASLRSAVTATSTTIDSISLTVTPPVAGTTSETPPDVTIANDAPYEIERCEWDFVNNETQPVTFEANTAYRISMSLKAKDGYKFASPIADEAVNCEPATCFSHSTNELNGVSRHSIAMRVTAVNGEGPAYELPAPTNLTWVSEGAEWDRVADADEYLFECTDPNGDTMTAYVSNPDSVSRIPCLVNQFIGDAEGNFTFAVTALADNRTKTSQRVVSEPKYFHETVDCNICAKNRSYGSATVAFTTSYGTSATADVNGWVSFLSKKGADVTVVATPETGGALVGWYEYDPATEETGALVSTSATYTFSADADTKIAAVFAPAETLTVNFQLSSDYDHVDSLTVNGNPLTITQGKGTVEVAVGQPVTVVVTTKTGYMVSNAKVVPTIADYTRVNSDDRLSSTITFTQPQEGTTLSLGIGERIAVTYDVNGGGKGTAWPEGDLYQYAASGNLIRIIVPETLDADFATPPQGMKYAGYQIGTMTIYPGDWTLMSVSSSSNTIKLAWVSSDTNLPVRCGVSGDAHGWGYINYTDLNGTYHNGNDYGSHGERSAFSALVQYGSDVTVRGVPDEGYALVGWYEYDPDTEEVGQLVSTNANYTYTATDKTYLKAKFAPARSLTVDFLCDDNSSLAGIDQYISSVTFNGTSIPVTVAGSAGSYTARATGDIAQGGDVEVVVTYTDKAMSTIYGLKAKGNGFQIQSGGDLYNTVTASFTASENSNGLWLENTFFPAFSMTCDINGGTPGEFWPANNVMKDASEDPSNYSMQVDLYGIPSYASAPTGMVFAGLEVTDKNGKHTGLPDETITGLDMTEGGTVKWLWSGGKTITFDANDTSATGTMEPVSVAEGDEYTLPECEFAASYKMFDHWEVKVGDGQPANKQPGEKVVMSDDAVAKAIWKEASVLHITIVGNGIEDSAWNHVTVTVDGASVAATGTNPILGMMIAADSAHTIVITPKEGYALKSASLKNDPVDIDADGKATIAIPTTVGKPMQFLATATIAPAHTVTFHMNGATSDAIPTQKVALGGKATKPADPQKAFVANENTFYESFGGWYAKEALTGDAYDFDAAVTGDVDLYAKWTFTVEVKASPANLDLSRAYIVDPNNQHVASYTQEVADGEEITLEAVAGRGYAFDHWAAPNSRNLNGAVTDIPEAARDAACGANGQTTGNGAYTAYFTELQPHAVGIARTQGGTVDYQIDSNAAVTHNESEFEEVVYSGETATLTAKPNDGSVFIGWTVATLNGSGQWEPTGGIFSYEETLTIKPPDAPQDYYYYALFGVSFTFDCPEDAENVPAVQKMSYNGSLGGKATRPATAPTRDDFDFYNWYQDADCTKLFDFTATYDENTSIYSKWVAKPISLMTMGGSGACKIDYAYTGADGQEKSGQAGAVQESLSDVPEGGTLTLTAVPDGPYILKEWKIGDSATSTDNPLVKTADAEGGICGKSIIASFGEPDVTFDVNGGTEGSNFPADATTDANSSWNWNVPEYPLSADVAAAPTDKHFAGVEVTHAGQTTTYAPGATASIDSVTSDISVKFLWADNPTVTLHWSSIDGADLESAIAFKVAPGTKIGDAINAKYNTTEALGYEPFAKDGYIDSGYRMPNPISSYQDEDALQGSKYADAQLIGEDGLNVYYIMFKIIPSVDVTVAQPQCGTVVALDGEGKQSNPPVSSVTAGQGYYVATEGFLNEPCWAADDSFGADCYMGTMAGGERYFAETAISAEFGYKFDGSLAASVNGTAAARVDQNLFNDLVYIKGAVEAAHIPGEAKHENEVAPTCTEKGSYDSVVRCSKCDAVISTEKVAVDALGHSWNAGTVTTEPTCTEKGSKTYTCTRCDETKTEELAALGHDWGEWAVVKEATETEAGLEKRVCSRCNAEETREIPPTPVTQATLTFDLAGGTLDGQTGGFTIVAEVGDVVEIPAAPTRDGYEFQYWKGSEYHPGDKYAVEGDHAFTAVWEKISSSSDAAKSSTTSKSSSSKSTASQSTSKTGDDSGTTAATLAITAACALALALFAMSRRGLRKANAGKHVRR